jgi:hypothetical protein
MVRARTRWANQSMARDGSIFFSLASSFLLSDESPGHSTNDNKFEAHPGTSIRPSKSSGERQRRRVAGQGGRSWKVRTIVTREFEGKTA